MSDEVDTKEPRTADASFGAPERALTVARSSAERKRYTGTNVMGAGVRRFAYASIGLGALVALPQFEGASTTAYAILVVGCLALAGVVAWVGAPWKLQIGLDGVLVSPRLMKRVVAWRELTSAALGDAPRGAPFEYMTVDLAWGREQSLSLPAWSLSGDVLREIRDEIESRVARAKSYVEPESIALVQRASRPVAQWIDGIARAKDAHFRQQNVDVATLIDAIESGALTSIDVVQCAVAVAVLGTHTQREALSRVAPRIIDESCAAAVRAAAARQFTDAAIDRATR